MVTRRRKALSFFLLCALVSGLILQVQQAQAAYGGRITVSGTKFYAGGNEIWINGTNTPWHSWNDFGGSFDYTWWDNHFQELRNHGVNSTRVWITCNGEVGINIDSSGAVSGATAAHWSNLDSLFQIAQNRGVYIMATMMSFDHFKNSHANYMSWRNMLNSDTNIDSYVNNYLIPFVNRYKNNPWLWSIDLMNEPDWVYENADSGNISWDRLQTYFAKGAVAIHQNSSILTTVGIAMVKYNSATVGGAQGNKVSDAALKAKVNSPLARVDFYSPHYYGWMDQYWGIPTYMTPDQYGIVHDRPVILGEMPAKGSTNHTITDDFFNAHTNGWAGLMPWTSNGVDSNGSLTDMGPATQAFRDSYFNLVFPTSDSAPYHFEGGALHSFIGTPSGVTVSSSSERAYAGSSSLKMTLNVTASGQYYAQVSNPANLTTGKTVTFRVWVPGNANLTAIQPYVKDNNWLWTGNYQSYANLTKNAWNTITVSIPTSSVNPIKELGVQVITSSSWNGSIYIDNISW